MRETETEAVQLLRSRPWPSPSSTKAATDLADAIEGGERIGDLAVRVEVLRLVTKQANREIRA